MSSGEPVTDQPEQRLAQSVVHLDVILQILESREFDVHQVVDQLNEFCPEVGQTIVDRANSPEFALRKQVSRVEHAIAVLGHRRLVQTLEKVRRHDAAQTSTAPHFLASDHPTPQPPTITH